LLNEAFDSGALCNTTARAVRVDIIVEVHGETLIGRNLHADRFRSKVKKQLIHECGVNLFTVRDADH
jgi:hypothetical protein